MANEYYLDPKIRSFNLLGICVKILKVGRTTDKKKKKKKTLVVSFWVGPLREIKENDGVGTYTDDTNT